MRSPRAAAIFGALLVAGAVLIAAAGPLGALPALLAFVVLFAGHYPGADRLDRLILAARRYDSRKRASSRRTPRLPIFVLISRGGSLIATSLAKRPPPALLKHA
jgi:hypothetical protein